MSSQKEGRKKQKSCGIIYLSAPYMSPLLVPITCGRDTLNGEEKRIFNWIT